ncbi:hypothetical protein CR513_42260, partial [Mucuna pruriens]
MARIILCFRTCPKKSKKASRSTPKGGLSWQRRSSCLSRKGRWLRCSSTPSRLPITIGWRKNRAGHSMRKVCPSK